MVNPTVSSSRWARPEAPPHGALEAYGMAGNRARRSRLLDPCWTGITISKPWEAVARCSPGISTTYVMANPDVRTHGIRIPARDSKFHIT